MGFLSLGKTRIKIKTWFFVFVCIDVFSMRDSSGRGRNDNDLARYCDTGV